MSSFEKIRDLCVDVGRTTKPRSHGLTIALDVGLGPAAAADLCKVAGDHMDFVKIAWGSSMITGALDEKIAAYRAGGVEPMFGGTLFEYAYLHGRVEQFLEFVTETKIHIEISDGTLDIPLSDKLKWIEKFAERTTVYSEIGGKISPHNRDWKAIVAQEFSAGSSMLVVEGREIGPVGQDIREDVVDELVDAAGGSEKLIFESLERKQQLFFIKKLGPNVNLANIRTGDVLTLESFRRGLKEHTLRHTWAALNEL